MSVQISTPCLPNTAICEGDYGCGPDIHMAAIARIMPIFHGKPWDANTAYGALEVVEQPDGVMYITKCPTPAGTPLENCTYWAIYNENWNVRLETVEKEIDQLQLEDKLTLELTFERQEGQYQMGTWSCLEGASFETIMENPQNVVIRFNGQDRLPCDSYESPAGAILFDTYITVIEEQYKRMYTEMFGINSDGSWMMTRTRIASQETVERIENEYKAADQTIVNNYTAADKVLEAKIDAIKPQITGFFIQANNANDKDPLYELISDYTLEEFIANPAVSALSIKMYFNTGAALLDTPLYQVAFAYTFEGLPDTTFDMIAIYGSDILGKPVMYQFGRIREKSQYWEHNVIEIARTDDVIDRINSATEYKLVQNATVALAGKEYKLEVSGYGNLHCYRDSFVASSNTLTCVFLASVSSDGVEVFEAVKSYSDLTVTKTIWAFDGTSSSVEVPDCTLYYR